MTRESRRLLAFCVGLLALLGVLEGLTRLGRPLIVAASHRALTKAAILDRHGDVDVLFFGSSRTQDGISPTLFAQELAALRPAEPPVRGFNLASASANLEILETLTVRVAKRPGLRLVVMELSEPQLRTDADPWGTASSTSPDTEGAIAAFVHDHVELVANRRAFFSDNLGRLATLSLFAPSLDGSEVMLSDQLRAWMGRPLERTPHFDAAAWAPRAEDVIAASSVAAPPGMVDRIVAIADRFKSAGVHVAFAVPPLTREHSPAPERAEGMRALFRDVRQRTGCPVWDWSSDTLPSDLFRGTSHLNPTGRAQYSRAMAAQVAASSLLAGAR